MIFTVSVTARSLYPTRLLMHCSNKSVQEDHRPSLAVVLSSAFKQEE